MISTSKNTLYLLIAYAYQKIAALVYFIFLARYLGVEDFGKYNFAISFSALFVIIIDFAFTLLLTREIARDKEKIKVYFGNILFFKIWATLFSVLLIFLLSLILKFPPETTKLVYLAFLTVILDSFANSFYGVFRGLLDMRFESLGLILHKTIMILTGFLFMRLGFPLIFMMLPMVFGSIVYFINALFFFRRKLGFWPKPIFENKTFKFLFHLALPFFGTALFSQVYLNIGPVFLSFLGGDKFVGYFSAANRIPLAIVALVGGAFGATFYPTFSYWFVREKSHISRFLKDGIFYLMLIALPIVVGGIALSSELIDFVYGSEYLPAAIALSILLFALPFQLIDYLMTGLLNAAEKQKLNFKFRIVGTLFFIVLNIFLIPKLFHIGVALSIFLSALLIFILEWIWLRPFLPAKKGPIFKKMFLILIISILMGLIVYYLKDSFHIILVILLGAIIYIGLSLLFRLVGQKDIKMIKNIFVKH